MGLARAVMALAAATLGQSRRDWALAMEGELEAAIDAGRPLAFAAGCLVAAWRDMPRQAEGRFLLASHMLALGMIVPMAALQFACAAGLAVPVPAAGGLGGPAAANAVQQAYLSAAYRAAEPVLLGLWLWLCLLQLRLAWLLLERDWPRMIRTGAMAAAVTAALVIFDGVMLLADPRTMLQAAALSIELAAVAASSQWHARLTGAAAPGGSAATP
ncbi:MAG TPA: hypothetical protein VFW19_00960 [Allosphingosinicella sp.]|nr:hypothetical protein [Allosphingosinicella sp.]